MFDEYEESHDLLLKLIAIIPFIIVNYFIVVVEKFIGNAFLTFVTTIFQSIPNFTIIPTPLPHIASLLVLMNAITNMYFYKKLVNSTYQEDFDGLLSMLKTERDLYRDLIVLLIFIIEGFVTLLY